MNPYIREKWDLDKLVTQVLDTYYPKEEKEENKFDHVVMPMVKRVFSKTIANDIVKVQPMSMPSGKLFYFDPVPPDLFKVGD